MPLGHSLVRPLLLLLSSVLSVSNFDNYLFNLIASSLPLSVLGVLLLCLWVD